MLRKILALTAIGLASTVGVAQAQTGGSSLNNNSMTASDGVGNPQQGPVGGTVTGQAGVYGANSNANMDVLSDPIRVGTFKADAAGIVRYSFVVPNVPVGTHTFRLSGVGADGKALVQSVSYVVTASESTTGGSTTGGLAKTGSNHSEPIAQIGAGAIAVGGLLVLGAKRRKAKATAAS
jgi:LPXTG-motif cell wall-anchored protein